MTFVGSPIDDHRVTQKKGTHVHTCTSYTYTHMYIVTPKLNGKVLLITVCTTEWIDDDILFSRVFNLRICD